MGPYVGGGGIEDAEVQITRPASVGMQNGTRSEPTQHIANLIIELGLDYLWKPDEPLSAPITRSIAQFIKLSIN
jgi:hypothetical protein